MNISDQVIKQGVRDDAIYAGRLFRDIASLENGALGAALSFCVIPYLSLFLHEARAKPDSIDPAVFAEFSREAKDICARARHSLKLFEDTKRGARDQLTYFEDDILTAHSARFLGNTWFRSARFLETDLGLYKYRGVIITTTHAATFHLGVEPTRLLQDDAGPFVAEVTRQYGRCFQLLGATFESGSGTFAQLLGGTEFSNLDRRSSKYYGRVFNGEPTVAINGVLTGFQAMMNFVDSVIAVGSDMLNLEYTVFKIRYLSLYAVLASLRMLHDDPNYSLSQTSMIALRGIIDSSEARLITDCTVKPFRNTLTHYNLVGPAAAAKADVNQPLFGLVPFYFPSHDFQSFSAVVDKCVRETAAALNKWSSS